MGSNFGKNFEGERCAMDPRSENEKGWIATTLTWNDRLDRAGSVDEVLSLTRDYLATLTPEQLARLPQASRPGRIKGDDDIEYWAINLAQAYAGAQSEPIDGMLMQDVLDIFLHASIRISHLRRGTHADVSTAAATAP